MMGKMQIQHAEYLSETSAISRHASKEVGALHVEEGGSPGAELRIRQDGNVSKHSWPNEANQKSDHGYTHIPDCTDPTTSG